MSFRDPGLRLTLSQSPSPRVIRVYSLQSCVPCDILKEALGSIANDVRNLGWEIDIIHISRDDKRSMGAALKAGVRSFPTVKFVDSDRVVRSYVSVRDGWGPVDVAQFLTEEIKAYAAMVNAVPQQH